MKYQTTSLKRRLRNIMITFISDLSTDVKQLRKHLPGRYRLKTKKMIHKSHKTKQILFHPTSFVMRCYFSDEILCLYLFNPTLIRIISSIFRSLRFQKHSGGCFALIKNKQLYTNPGFSHINRSTYLIMVELVGAEVMRELISLGISSTLHTSRISKHIRKHLTIV